MAILEDGIALYSAAHPKPVWWMRWKYWFLRDLSQESLETIEIDIPESQDNGCNG